MTFEWHHPNYYKKLKQNSEKGSHTQTQDTVSEVCHNPSTMETKVGPVGRVTTTHTNQKENK